MTIDQDFLLYPLATADLPNCPACGGHMVVALHEVRDKRPDFLLSGATPALAPNDMFAKNRRANTCDASEIQPKEI
jgi:hypothetical protein